MAAGQAPSWSAPRPVQHATRFVSAGALADILVQPKVLKRPTWLLQNLAGLPGPVIRMIDWRLSLDSQTLAAWSGLVAIIACTFCAHLMPLQKLRSEASVARYI